MNRHSILFLPHNKKIEVDDGSLLIQAAMDAGVHINASCGGEGVCGKCRVLVEHGSLSQGISEKLSKEDIENGYRLACLAQVEKDVTIRIPVESNIDASVLNLQSVPRIKARIKQMNFDDLKEQGLFLPPVEKIYLELPEPSSGDNGSDISRLMEYLRNTHEEHQLQITLGTMRKAPDVMREQNFKITVTIERPVRDGGKSRIINIQSGDTTDKNYAIAIDIGTTTVYGQLIDLITGEALAEYGDFNGQISYGEDVITRIMYAEKPEGLKRLHTVVVLTINKVIGKIVKQAGVDLDDVSSMTVAGNTTMTQLLMEINPKYIRRSPYVPTASLYPPFRASDIDIAVGKHVPLLVYPQISSYVGGDIVAGVMGAGIYRTDKLTLYLDIGTNAEIVIGNKEWLTCAACSAGPAFEGGGVKFGMRAAKGAIEDFSIDPISLEPMNITIGNVRPKGICGSGLINIVATLFEMGVIDNRGKLNRELNTDRIREVEGVYEYVLAWKDVTQIDRDIAITETDIDNLIRAKGAIYSGCMTLLEEVGLTMDSVEQIILAGGFGSYVDLEKSITIGLLPEIDSDRFRFIGNGSLLGAKMSSLTNSIRKDVGRVTSMMTNFELSETASYMDNYMAALFLPHTDINHFPKLKDRMQQNKAIWDARKKSLNKGY
ncbi:MAG: DUF4445 domain-containing protein [Proteobacteria bacterium]|nr:DUF4445 domain-containing protein [Pseudomonadota bacterium]